MPQPAPPVDLSNCAREPIHIPGAVQPHGCLLVFESDGTITQHSANAADILRLRTNALVGQPLEQALGGAAAADVLCASPDHGDILRLRLGDRVFEALVRRAPQLQTIVELEPDPDADPREIHELLWRQDRLLDDVLRAPDFEELVDRAARAFRDFTGYDRVMVYRFDRDMHGQVIAESKRADLPSYLGLHYPASDIPEQARRLYKRNLLRQIVDITYRPSPLVPLDNPVTGAPLDLSDVSIRSVSPIHIEYLHNMGVRATLVVSIPDESGELWGLISCHHYAPKRLPHALRRACEGVGRVLGFAARAHEDRARQRRIAAAAAAAHRVVSDLAETRDLRPTLERHADAVLRLADARGAAVSLGSSIILLGETPSPERVERILAWLEPRLQGDDLYATETLALDHPDADALREHAAGLLALRSPARGGGTILWFRPEAVSEVTWAGDPTKPVLVSPDGEPRLSPRKSFEAWSEIVRSRARPWRPVDLEAARSLRFVLLNAAALAGAPPA